MLRKLFSNDSNMQTIQTTKHPSSTNFNVRQVETRSVSGYGSASTHVAALVSQRTFNGRCSNNNDRQAVSFLPFFFSSLCKVRSHVRCTGVRCTCSRNMSKQEQRVCAARARARGNSPYRNSRSYTPARGRVRATDDFPRR